MVDSYSGMAHSQRGTKGVNRLGVSITFPVQKSSEIVLLNVATGRDIPKRLLCFCPLTEPDENLKPKHACRSMTKVNLKHLFSQITRRKPRLRSALVVLLLRRSVKG